MIDCTWRNGMWGISSTVGSVYPALLWLEVQWLLLGGAKEIRIMWNNQGKNSPKYYWKKFYLGLKKKRRFLKSETVYNWVHNCVDVNTSSSVTESNTILTQSESSLCHGSINTHTMHGRYLNYIFICCPSSKLNTVLYPIVILKKSKEDIVLKYYFG